jgi:hypothetical protein
MSVKVALPFARIDVTLKARAPAMGLSVSAVSTTTGT